MIDIHAHILPFVDDGSDEEEISLNILKSEYNAGVTDIILTPHYCGSMHKTPQELNYAFQLFKKIANKIVDVNLYLGQEIYVSSDIKQLLNDNKVLTMNGTKFVLLEFSSFEPNDIPVTVYELKNIGYEPIIAHIERYPYVDLDTAFEIKSLGGYIQINASTLVGRLSRVRTRFIKQLFKNDLVDFVASDLHAFRENLMADAYKYIKRKYGEEVAQKVFVINAKKIIQG